MTRLLILCLLAQPLPDCDVLCMVEGLIEDVAKLQQGSDAVWKPERDCWVVYTRCERLEVHRAFAQNMTGPGGRLYLESRTESGEEFSVPIVPSEIWALHEADPDLDGDIDLKDFALMERER